MTRGGGDGEMGEGGGVVQPEQQQRLKIHHHRTVGKE